MAPQLTWLYTFATAPPALPQLSLLPACSPTPADQRAHRPTSRAAGVRLAVVDRRRYREYGHTSFGESFGGEVDRWLRSGFRRVLTFSPGSDEGRHIEIWRRRAA